MRDISTCLWFDHQAEEASALYTSLFKNSKTHATSRYGEAGAQVSGQKKGSIMTVDFEIEGLRIQALNGGPMFKLTPALSFSVWREDEKEAENLWKKLSDGGSIRMGWDKYPWAARYGWVSDRFGVDWQIMLTDKKQIAPCFLFVDRLFGKAEEAMNFYVSTFRDSKTLELAHDPKTKSLLHGSFELAKQKFTVMDGAGNHGFSFNEAFSLMLNCDTQAEIDDFWSKLSEGGSTGPCGWLKDKYGVSWQVVPANIGAWMTTPERSERVMKAMLKMGKIDIKTLEEA